jgi:hypothetical protein
MINRMLLCFTFAILLLSPNAGFAQGRAAERERLRAVMAPGADPELFRRELDAYLDELREVSALYQELDRSLRAPARLQTDPAEQLLEARRRLPELTAEELATLRAGFARSPYWRELPRVLESFLEPDFRQRLRARAGAEAPVARAIPDNCTDARNANISLTDVSIAKGVELAAAAVMEGFPTDGLTIAARIAPVAVWAAAAGVTLSLEQLNAILDSCDGNDFITRTDGNLDVKVSTRASQTTAAAIQTRVDANLDAMVSTRATQTSVNNVQTGVNTAITNIAALQGTANSTQAEVVAIRQKVDANLDVKVSSRATQTSVNTLQGTANTINTKVDLALEKLDALARQLQAFQDENLRLQIELNLQLGPRYNTTQFQLPQAQGGHLERVRDIVADTIAKSRDAGLPVNPGAISQAQEALNTGNTYFAAKAFKDAFASYRTAYLLLAVVTGNRQP